jgi:hypothetical protein
MTQPPGTKLEDNAAARGKYGDLVHARFTAHKTEANAHPAPTGLSSPAYREWLDYIVIEDGHAGALNYA